MFKIAKPNFQPPTPQEAMMTPEQMVPEEMMQEQAPPVEAAPEDPTSSGLVSLAVAGYKGPEQGPFLCGNCQFFGGENTCTLVAGEIDPEGVCNLFTAPEVTMDDMEEELPLSEEAPMEEPELPAELMAE